MKEPLVDIEVNCKGTINLLEAVRRFNARAKVVHVGTSTQVGRMIGKTIDEEHAEFPLDIYSANKSAAENYVLIYGRVYDLHTTVVRLSNTYGPRSNIASADHGFMNYFIGLALQNKELTIFGEGKQRRGVNYVADAVQALVLAAESTVSDGEVFFVGSERQHSVTEIAQAVVSEIGGQVVNVPWPKEREVIEIGDALVSSEKIKRVLGWQAKYDLVRGLKETKKYYADRMPYYFDRQEERVSAPL